MDLVKNKALTAVIVDACPLFRESLAKLLHEDSQLGMIAETGDMYLGQFYMERFKPDLVLIDLHLKNAAGIELLKYTQQVFKDCYVIMLTDRDDSTELMQAVHMQAQGYLSKLIEVDELIDQIKRVANGEIVVSNRLMQALTRSFRMDVSETTEQEMSVLSEREIDVLKCLSTGMSNHEISHYLGIAYETTKVHVRHILKKMNFTSRTQAALWAREKGLQL